LKSALIFAAIYAIVIFATAGVREHFAGGALYVVAVVSGLVDVDAITLSQPASLDHSAWIRMPPGG